MSPNATAGRSGATLDALAAALRRAWAQRGAEGSIAFGLGELAAEYGGPEPKHAGRALRQADATASLGARVAASGLAVAYEPPRWVGGTHRGAAVRVWEGPVPNAGTCDTVPGAHHYAGERAARYIVELYQSGGRMTLYLCERCRGLAEQRDDHVHTRTMPRARAHA